MRKLIIVSCAMLLLLSMSGISKADLIIDNSTLGYYNQAIGTSLDRTNPYGGSYLFPGPNSSDGDPTFNNILTEPDLSSASAILGNWLDDPANLNSYWSGPQTIPSTWAINSETAIIYAINAGMGFQDVIFNFGVDNGIFVWLDGAFLSGQLRPGGAYLGEHVIDYGGLSAGIHYLQILREDHGGSTGYSVQVTGTPVPEPVTMLLLGSGLVGLAGLRRKIGKK